MTERRRWRPRLLVAAVLALTLGGAAALPAADLVHRLGIDLLLGLRHVVTGPLFPAERSDVVAVVIDEETYGSEPFVGTPQVAWTPLLARVIEGIDAAAPTAIGLDVIYPTTLDQPRLLPGYDKPLLRAFLKSGRAGRLVLGQARLSQQVIGPNRRQLVAAGGEDNLRTVNLLIDADEVVRRYPAGFADEAGGRQPSFGMELARRAGAAPPDQDFLINFNTGGDDIPVFGLGDLHACLEAGDDGFFARHFRDRIVLIGTSLDLEDRRSTAKRFAQARPDRSRHPRCGAPFDPARWGEIVGRRTIPGVFIHAAAINTVTKGIGLSLAPPAARAAVVGATAGGLALAFFAMPPLAGVAVALAALAALAAAALGLFLAGLVAPLFMLALAAALAYVVVYAFRFMVEDRQKRWIQHAFRHFLAPDLVDRLADDPSILALGGRRRRVTVMFLDVAGFTTLSEGLGDRPEMLVEVMNQVFSAVTAEVEASQGYVDKFIGDAVMAVWGAPLDDAMAEIHAADAALASLAAIERVNREVITAVHRLPPVGVRVGLACGVAIVGNMGSRTRLNYTATGDVVNLASRLEGANKVYGTRVMVNGDVARRLRRDFLLRRLDRLVVKGKTRPVAVWEVVVRHDDAVPAQRRAVADFHAALALYWRRRFGDAARAFAALADADPVAGLYLARCRLCAEVPPPPRWDRSFALDSK